MMGGNREEFSLEYPCHSPDLQRWFNVRVTRFPGEAAARIVVAHENITERKLVEEELLRSRQALRALTARLDGEREEARTRMAREIHDELGHAFTDLKLDLAWLARRLTDAGFTGRSAIRKRIAAMSRRVESEAQAVRRIATDLRPPVLDALGLAAAIEWQAREFQDRTRIRCGVDTPENPPALDAAQVTALFRVFQEILINVARHAQATRVEVRLTEKAGRLVLQVRDNGRGITPAEQSSPHALGTAGDARTGRRLGWRVHACRHAGPGNQRHGFHPHSAGMSKAKPNRLSILLTEDHATTRLGIKQILQEEFPRIVFGEARDARETFALLEQRSWSLLILDIESSRPAWIGRAAGGQGAAACVAGADLQRPPGRPICGSRVARRARWVT